MQTATLPAARDRAVDPDVRAVLIECRIDGNVVMLPPRQIDRGLYVRVDKVLTALGGKWNRKRKGHEFPTDPGTAIAQAADEGIYNNRKQDLQFFETPTELATRMHQAVDLRPGDRIIDPSAGRGRLLLPLPLGVFDIHAVEIDPVNAGHLRLATQCRPDFHLREGDFLAMTGLLNQLGHFTVALMNPPFARNQDVIHIMTAWRLLGPGGRLAAICSEHPFIASDGKSAEFGHWLETIGADCNPLPASSFAKSGTSVSTRLIVARKPR